MGYYVAQTGRHCVPLDSLDHDDLHFRAAVSQIGEVVYFLEDIIGNDTVELLNKQQLAWAADAAGCRRPKTSIAFSPSCPLQDCLGPLDYG
jgi:hypothetical protein